MSDNICQSCINFLENGTCSKRWKCDSIVERNTGCKDYTIKTTNKLTKREHFAFEFAKISAAEDVERKQTDSGCRKETAIYAVSQADELIRALNEKNEEPKEGTFMDFAKVVGPIAKLAGYTENDVVQYYRHFSKSGVNGAKAGVIFRKVISRIMNKEKEDGE